MSAPLRGMVYALGDLVPRVHPSAFIAPGALVAGDVEIGEEVSVWPGCVLRGDYGRIVIGQRSNVQDGTVIHATGHLPTLIGEEVVIGHGARLEGCTIHDAALIGMGSIVLHEVVVGSGAVVAAGAVVTPRTVVPPGAMARGVPAQIVAVDDETRDHRVMVHRMTSAHYWENAQRWMREMRAVD
ncbi:MAG TPA: gamma carbonic anhydrase family protein [Candidatus Dormibacteraeota bacterium]|jgi:carbonic anhydrase/acetyltransferase-like protein (isoleucine patch superfamily)|nr:gamma carbonic anhydrase family protein [Candidatus Dormibacteraeota bacterium]